MDSDLAESFTALRDAFERRQVPANFESGQEELIAELKAALKLPRRYRAFLLQKNPTQCETQTPSERVRLLPAEELKAEQEGFSLEQGRPIERARMNGWKPGWVIIGHSSLLGDPYFLDVTEADAEGDCPVYTAMSGTDVWQPQLCASSFALFLRVLAITMEVAEGFHESDLDYEDEFVFREALGPRIRDYDPAAAKAGHWT